MKILILANSDKGLYNFRKELIERLISENNEVYISVPSGQRTNNFISMGCSHIDTQLDSRGTNPIKDIRLVRKYIKIIKEIKPDIVLTYTIKPNIYGGIACRMRKTPYITNITGLGSALEKEGILQKVLIQMYKIALKSVKCCFAQNEENMKFLKEHITSTDKFKLLPGSGVNLNNYKLMDYPKENEKIKFLFMSRIMKEKGIDQYLETAKYIKSKYSNVEFHILGAMEDKYEPVLKKMEKDGIIFYHGMQMDVKPYLKECACLIHPSYYPEGMSNVILEASASGRPIITTDRSGCREIVNEGETGFVVPTKNSEAIIEAVERFLRLSYEERKVMGLKAREKVEREFDRNIVINLYIKEIGVI